MGNRNNLKAVVVAFIIIVMVVFSCHLFCREAKIGDSQQFVYGVSHGRKFAYVGSTTFVLAYSMLYSTTVHVLFQSRDRQARRLAIASQKS